MKYFLSTLAFVVFAAASTYGQTNYDFVYTDSIIKNGVAFHDKHDYNAAINQFDLVSKTDPKFLQAQYEKSLSLSSLQKKDELRALFVALYPKMPEYPGLYTVYGSFLSDQKEYDAAQKILNEGEKYLSNSSMFFYNMAILQIRMENRQKGVDYLKKTISINPNYGSAHYFLGLLALEDGQISQGTIALMSYLVLMPTGKYSENAILKMNQKYGENFLATPKLKLSDSGDDFSELDEILRNQLALKKTYKIKSTIDDTVIRQMQAVAEFSSTHKSQDGFFETTYLPWIKAMYDQNLFEGFSYYSLLSIEERLGKSLTSQKKKISSFTDNFILKDFWPLYATRTLTFSGEKQTGTIYMQDGMPYYIGESLAGKREGKYIVFDNIGNISARINYKNNELDGLQKYYDNKGLLTEEKTFTAGVLNGIRKTFYANGNPDLVENYSNGKLNGLATSYHVNGGKNCELNYSNGNADGNLLCFYPNGSKKSDVNYIAGKYDGSAKYYNQIGDLTATYVYKQGERDGKSTEFYDGKTLLSEGDFTAGKGNGTYKKLYGNGATEIETEYVGGKVVKRTTFLINGAKSLEAIFDGDENIERYVYYDTFGNKYFEEKWKKGELKGGVQHGANASKAEEFSLSKKAFVIKSFNGNVQTDGFFDKGKKTGEWKYRYSSGLLRLSENYVAGLQHGLSTTFTRTGKLHQIANYKNDVLHGRLENYAFGHLSHVTNYVEDVEQGPYRYFSHDGLVSAEGFVVDNEVVGQKIAYWRNQNIMSISTYIENSNTKTEFFTPSGTSELTIDYTNKNGNLLSKLHGGALIENCGFKNGLRDGSYVSTDQFGQKIAELTFVNGLKNGAFKFYNPNGTMSSDGKYYCGKLHGQDRTYDMIGNLRNTSDYYYGDQIGLNTRYYYNKNKWFEYTELDGIKEGDYLFFNQKGEAVASINFRNNAPASYKVLGSDGKLGEPVAILNESATIVSKYPNNQQALALQLKNGNWQGKLVIQNPDGKIACESLYEDGLIQGERVENYVSGKLFKKEHFVDGMYHGKAEYFSEDGKPLITSNYVFDLLHGDVLIYTNGILTTTKKYDTDELVATIK